MKLSDTLIVLASIQRLDRRDTSDPLVVEGWAEALGDITLKDALAAVSRHRATSTEWLMPAHITQLVGKERARRHAMLTAAGPPDYPDDLTWAQEQRYGGLYRRAVLAGMDRKAAHKTADAEFGAAPRRALVTAPVSVQATVARFTAARTV